MNKKRLHLGAKDVGNLSQSALRPLIDESWTHLVEKHSLEEPLNTVDRDAGMLGGIKKRLRPLVYRLNGLEFVSPIEQRTRRARIKSETNLLPFHYEKGDRLPFDRETFSFVFSEHFFEHLFLDEACELFKECHRVLRPRGCMRIVVPDADLRTYEPPEPIGFTTDGASWSDPGKHKTRWSIYSLTYCLEQTGFWCRPVVYCDKAGNYFKNLPQKGDEGYADCVEDLLILEFSYVQRLANSLVVDAFK